MAAPPPFCAAVMVLRRTSLPDVGELERRVDELETELECSNETLQHLIYVASHDLQQPLRMVFSYTQLIAKRYKGKLDADADEFIAYAIDGATQMHDLITDLLRYSRIASERLELAHTDCGEMVDRILESLAGTIEETRAEITRGPLPTVWADPRQLIQVLQQLIENAIRFRRTGAPVSIRIEAESCGSAWMFSIADNGIGVELKNADRIFAVFQRLHSREANPGTGIGLALCKKIVQRHRGRIWVAPNLPTGTVFRFTISNSKEEA